MTAQWRAEGARIGVVPTMGALHRGHLSLVKAAKVDCDRVIVWIFVNPKQFNSAQDLANYPRTEHEDAQKLAPLGIDAVYAPDVDQVYPDGFATVVSKIFLQTGADRAYFGEKDFQQVQVVRRVARDLDIPIEVVACPTVRDPSGLALSSRNLRLSPEGLKRAAGLYPVLRDMAAELADGSRFAPLADRARARLAEAGFDEVEYLELRSEEQLSALDHADRPARLFAAVWIDGVRLIDNLAVPAV